MHAQQNSKITYDFQTKPIEIRSDVSETVVFWGAPSLAWVAANYVCIISPLVSAVYLRCLHLYSMFAFAMFDL